MSDHSGFSFRSFLITFAGNALSIAAIFTALVMLTWVLGWHVASFGHGRPSVASHSSGNATPGYEFVAISFLAVIGGWLNAYEKFFTFPKKQRVLLLGAVFGAITPNLVALALAPIGFGMQSNFGDPLLWLQSIAGFFVASLMALYWFSCWTWLSTAKKK
ncbi:MAG: hypothetical protein ACREO5_11310 [Candidatus Binatia bacterium]